MLSAVNWLVTSSMTSMMTILNLSGKTSQSRLPDLEGTEKYARGYLPSLPIFYVFAKRGEYIKDTFGQARHQKLARWVGRTSRTPCSLVSCLHG